MSSRDDPEAWRSSASKRDRSPDDRPRRAQKAGCFECGGTDHLKRDCPNLKRARMDAGPAADGGSGDEDVEKELVNYGTSGLLQKDTATFKGVTLKWNEPPDMKLPKDKWRLYVFKGDQQLKEPYVLHRVPAYMFGRERKVVDIPVDHPSCSNQHAVICFRLVDVHVGDDMIDGPIYKKRVRPYIIDLESRNGTILSGKKIEAARYYQLQHQDIVQFGTSTREYVLMNMTEAERQVEKSLEDAGQSHLVKD